MSTRRRTAVIVAALVAATLSHLAAQSPPPAAPASPRAGAPIDLTGTWVSVVTEDWRWRMRTPPQGDYASLPLNAQGRKVADTWDPSKDGSCEAYGVGGVMRIPGRVRISWQDETTLKLETDAGQQTRLLRFASTPPSPSSSRSWQGNSVAVWQRSGGAADAFLTRRAVAVPSMPWGTLKVVTTGMRAGWLRRNGVPYSQNATVTEHFTRFVHPQAGDWFVVTTIVEDPQYLDQPFITSSNFKREPDNSKWSPTPCRER